jgi:predicted transcriptional regulator of viral defense system
VVIQNAILEAMPVFATSEVIEVTGLGATEASRELHDLERQGIIIRVQQQLWAVVHHPKFSTFAVVPYLLDEPDAGYVSLLSALNLHAMIEQIPRVIHVMTRLESHTLRTPIGTYEFHEIAEELIDGFGPYRGSGNFSIATPEKAVFDTMFISAGSSGRFAHLPELEIPSTFSSSAVEEWIARVKPAPRRASIVERWRRLWESAGDPLP